MAELTKQALKVANNTEFPNNNNGQITPTRLRTFNEDMIDSLVDEISYTADSASFNSRINSVTGSTVNTGSLLVTASFNNGTRNLTFTKGDASTFAVNIPDVSGSTGNFATTGSNTFIGTQTISGSVLPLVDGQGDLGTDSLKWNSVVVNGQIKGSSINASGRNSLGTIRLLDESFPLSFLDAREIVADGNGADTHLYYGTGSASDALREFVYAQSGSNADFTSVSASFDTRINNVTGSSINTGSFATTGSNAFIGNQTIAGGLIVSSSTQPVSITGSSFVVDTTSGGPVVGGNITFKPGTSIQFQGNTDFSGPVRAPFVNVDNDKYYGFNNDIEGRIYQGFSGSVDSRINAIVTGTGFATTGSNTFTGNQNIQGTLTASLQEGYVWAGGAGNISTLVATSSFGGGGTIDTGSFATTGSNTFIGNQTITSDGNTQLNISSSLPSGQANVYFQAFQSNFQAYGNFNVNNNGQFGGSGSISMLASNNFVQIGADNGIRIGSTNGGGNGMDAGFANMQVRSGTLSLAPAGFTNNSASLSHLSSSSNTNFVNLMFKNTGGATPTIISGSNNIFVNPTNVTAGFTRYIGGSNNIFTAALPQLTGSAAFSPSIFNNFSATGMILRAPVSSSAYAINGNVLLGFGGTGINLGVSAANNFERAVSGLTMQNNFIGGTLNAVAAKTPLSASVNISNNNIGGVLSLSMDSSSINLNGSTIQGSLTVNNSYFPSTYASNTANLGINAGVYIGSNNAIFASGSNATFPTNRSIGNSGIIGSSNTISASLNGDRAQVQSTILLGQALVAIGSNTVPAGVTGADYGSVFVGRWNSLDGTKDLTAETVFAVGTGTGASTRKTGFLIDSGSNTFIEGTLNVSGSTTITGSLTVTDLIVSGSSQFNGAQYSSLVTQSGSAAVSQSVTFDTTGPQFGVSLVDNTKITVANTGTYNIQFSAQILADSGADNVFIWFKKNGTNIAGSASELAVANNDEALMTVNILDTAVANDYYELCWQTANGDAVLLSSGASGNVPSIPSIILTVTQVR